MPTPTQVSAFSKKLARITAGDLDKPDLPNVPSPKIVSESPDEVDQDLEDFGDPSDQIDLLEPSEETPPQEDPEDFDVDSSVVSAHGLIAPQSFKLQVLEPARDVEDGWGLEGSDPQEFHRLTEHLSTLNDEIPSIIHLDSNPDPEDDFPLEITPEDLGDDLEFVDGVENLLGGEMSTEPTYEDPPEQDDDGDDDNSDLRMFDLLSSFLEVNPSPSDEQFHLLAQAVGIPHEDFEAHIYRIIGVMLEDEHLEKETRDILSSFLK